MASPLTLPLRKVSEVTGDAAKVMRFDGLISLFFFPFLNRPSQFVPSPTRGPATRPFPAGAPPRAPTPEKPQPDTGERSEVRL